MKTMERVITSLTADALIAWMLMFALALLGHPRFGFLELWLAVSVVTSAIAAGVRVGVRSGIREFVEDPGTK